jgi:signal peptidase I
MKGPGRKTVILTVVLIVFLIVFGYFVLTYTRRVSGTSMLPTLKEGDLVVIQVVNMSAVHNGNIIVYDPPCSAVGEAVIHRVVGTENGGFITKGDNNPITDQAAGIAASPITANCLVGKVVFVIPYLELIASLPYGANYAIAALIVLIVVVIEFYPRNQEEPMGEGGVEKTQPVSTG